MIKFLTGLLALGAFVASAMTITFPAEPLSPGSVALSDVVPADLPSACPGWMRLPVGEGSEEDEGENGGDSLDPRSGEVTRATYTSSADVPDATGVGYSTPSDVATALERIGRGDLSGLATVTCHEPRTDSWIVGGSTRLGSSARLVIINPTSVTSDVVVTIYGPGGPTGQAISASLGGRSSESILLEGLAAELATLVVHVKAGGAGVVAMIQDSRLNGFLPAGTEWVMAGANPTERVIVPGVGPSDPEGDDGPATVRLMAPEGATLSLTAVGTDGPLTWPGSRNLVLDPGAVIDVDVPTSGVTTVIVSANRPVVASAISRLSRLPVEGLQGDLDREFAWVPGQAAAAEGDWRAVVPGYVVTLVAYAEGATTMRIVDATTGAEIGGAEMAEGTMILVPLSVAAGTVLAVEGDVVWVLRVEDEPAFVSTISPIDVMDYAEPVAVGVGVYVP